MQAAAVTATWLVLVAATLLAWALARGGDVGRARAFIPAAIIILAAVKIHLVLDVFMGLRYGPAGWRLGLCAWLVVTAGIVFFFVQSP